MSLVTDYPEAGAKIGTTLKPKRFDIDIYQGDTFSFFLTFTDQGIDVTGWTGSAVVKAIDTKVAVSNAVTVSAVDTVNKRFTVSLDSDLLDPGVEYMYDVQVTDAGGNKRTFIGGKVTVDEDITEP